MSSLSPAQMPFRSAHGSHQAALAALAQRIADAISAAEVAAPESSARAIVFRVGSMRLALPLTSIREVVIPPERLTLVPRAAAGILGIMNLRGRVVAVVDLLCALPGDLAARCRQGAEEALDREGPAVQHVLLLLAEHHEIGLLVGDVDGIAALPEEGAATFVLLDPERVLGAIAALVL